jgi:arylsulfate sulfotransferase
MAELNQLLTALLTTVTEDNLITKTDTTAVAIEFHLENGEVISAPSHLLAQVDPNPAEWRVNLRFEPTGESLALPFRGDSYEIELVTDFDQSLFPLIQPLEISVPFRGRITYTVHGKSGAAADVSGPAVSLDRTTTVTVLGLYSAYVSQVTVDYYNSAGVLRNTQELALERARVPPTPQVEILVNDYVDGPVKLFLTHNRTVSARPFIIDQFGDIRWYADFNASYGLQQSRNGNILFSTNEQVLELALDGRVVRSYNLPRPYSTIHHDIHELSNGNLLLTVNSDNLDTREDVVVLLDREVGLVLRVWDLNASIPKNFELINDPVDWLHVNAVTFDERDMGVVVSGQRRGLFKVSWDNELVWILSDGRGFENSAEYLIDANHDVFWGQHDVRLDEENDLYYVFDNGLGRNYSNVDRYSRGVKFKVAENSMSSTLVAEYGEDLPEYYSPIISGIDYQDDGNVLLNFGSIGYEFTYTDNTDWAGESLLRNNPPFGAAWVEYAASGEILFHARFSMLDPNGSDYGIYRARYVDMFKEGR